MATRRARAPRSLAVAGAMLMACASVVVGAAPAEAVMRTVVQGEEPCTPIVVPDCDPAEETTTTTVEDSTTTTEEAITTTTARQTTTTERRTTTTVPAPTTTVPETITTVANLLVPGDGTDGAESTTTTAVSPTAKVSDDGPSDGTLIALVIAGLLVIALVVSLLTWRYWVATRPPLLDEGPGPEGGRRAQGPITRPLRSG